MEHAQTLRIRLMASFLKPYKMVTRFFNFSKNSNNLGIMSESNQKIQKYFYDESFETYLIWCLSRPKQLEMQ